MKTAFIIILVGAFLFSCQKEISCEDCKEDNQPPIAVAGQDQVITLPTDSVSLDGSGSSDPDGTINNWLWKKISGPASFNIIRPTDSITKVKLLTLGTYQFELEVTDDDGVSAIDTVQITVKDLSQPNRPPVANAGADQTITLPTNTITLNGTGSTDPDNNITSYAWTKITGPSSFNIGNSNITQTQVTNLVEGIYQFELKVTDAGALFSKDTMQVLVLAAPSSACNSNGRPIVNAQLIPVGTLSQTRRGMAVASAGNKIVFAGGFTNISGNTTYQSRVDIYDISTQTWSIAELSVPRTDIAAVSTGTSIFFAGGRALTSSNTFQYYATVDIYDAITNTWTVSSLSEARSLIAGATVGGKVFFAGGSIHNNINFYGQAGIGTAKVDIYDLNTHTWSSTALSEPRGEIAAATVQNKIYFAGGGSNDPNSLGVTNRIDIYDDITGTWSISSLQEAKTSMASIAVGNKTYWAGGNTWPFFGVWTCSVEMIDINGTHTVSNLHAENWWEFNGGNRAVLKDGKIIFCITPWNSAEFDIYDTNTNVWSVGVLPSVCNGNSIISVNNTVYIAGGYVNGVPSNKVWKLEF